jgi:predicted phosphodiesterase
VKILAISDVESKYLWDYFQPEKLEGVDLILSCGDLKASYLTLLATFTHAPLLYVHGNHDTDYQRRPPEGCTCIEDTVYEVNGVRIAGLGGSVRYKPGPFQYTQREMERRVARLSSKIRRMGGVDIIVAHAPVRAATTEKTPHIWVLTVSTPCWDSFSRSTLCMDTFTSTTAASHAVRSVGKHR